MRRYNILVVDDEQAIQSLFARLLLAKGYRVTCVGSGPEAIERVKADDFDVVFTDIVMAGMDGIATFRALVEVKPNLQVVLMTGYAIEEKIREGLELGAVGYLRKPFDITEPIAILTKLERREDRNATNR